MRFADAFEQGNQRAGDACKQGGDEQPAQRLLPVGKICQYDGVPHEREINGDDKDVEFGKPAVGYAFDECGDKQDEGNIKSDFANFFGKVALGSQPIF